MAEKSANVTGLLAAMGSRLTQVQAEHRGKEVNLGRPELPGGIEGGIAQIVTCRIGKFEKGDSVGKPFFDASATVMVPDEVNGRPCRGLQTRIGPEPLCETLKSAGKRKTFSEHYKWFRDQLIGLGFNIDNLTGTPQQIEAQILAGLEQLKKSKPYILFRTSKLPGTTIEKDAAGKWWVIGGPSPGKKGPYATEEMLKKANPNAGGEGRIYHEWNGLCHDFDPSSIAEAASHDNSPKANGQAQQVVTQAEAQVEAQAPPDMAPDEAPVAEGQEQVDLTVLCEAAKANGDGPEAVQLTNIARESGITDEQIEAATSWDEVLVMVEAALGVGPAAEAAVEPPPEPEPETPKVPEKGRVFKYKLLDPKTGKPAVDPKNPKTDKRPVDVEVLTVDAKSMSCTIKDLAAGKPVLDPRSKLPLRVKWADLIS